LEIPSTADSDQKTGAEYRHWHGRGRRKGGTKVESGRHCGKEAGGEGMGREASEGGGRGKQRVGRRGGMGVCGRGQDGAGMGQRGVGRRVGSVAAIM